LWLLAGIAVFSLVFAFMFLPETLYDNILLRRARKLRRETGDNTICSQSEVDTESPSISLRIAKQVVRDFKMSFADPIIIFVNLYTMLIYGVLYVWFEFFSFGKTKSKSLNY
jgi:MFS transporter, DHA1 family, multidrug resistance protein